MGKRKALESEEDTKATDQVDQTAFSKVKKNKGPTALVASPEFIDQNLYYSPSEPVDIVEESRVGPGLLSPSRDILIIVDGNLVESDSIGSVEVPDFTDPVESEINSSNSIDSVEVPYFIDPDDYSDSESEVDMAKELEGNNSHSTPSKLALNTDGELAEEVANNVGSRDLRKLASPSKHFQEMPKEDVENDKIITINQNNFAAFIKYLNPNPSLAKIP